MERNKNYQRIDKLIINSFINVCKKEKAESISVSMVCKEADINRTTFYNHYKDIWEIVEVIEGEIIKKINHLFATFSFHQFLKNPSPTLSKLNDIIKEKPDYYQKLFELSQSRFFIDKLKEIFTANLLKDADFLTAYKDEVNAKSAASFFVGGLSNVYSDWLGNKIECPLDEITKGMAQSILKYGKTLNP